MINKFTNNEKTKCCMNCEYLINLSTDCPVEAYYPDECPFKNNEKHKVLTFSDAKSMTDKELRECLYIVDEELKNRSDKREQLRNKLQSEVINLCRECRDNGFKLRFDLTDKYMYELLQEHSVYAYVNELYVEDDKNK